MPTTRPRAPEVAPLVVGTKLSQITASGVAAVAGDQFVGVHGGTTDLLFGLGQIQAGLALFTSATAGQVPASGGGTTNFLRADGTWAAPPGGAGGITIGTTTITGGTSGNFEYNNAGVAGERTPAQATAALNLFTTALQGLVPASGGGTTNFLRADGTWAAPAGGGGGLPLIGTGATVTASAPLLDLSQTWNNAAVAFTGIRANFTNTASTNASKLFDFQASTTGGSGSFFYANTDGSLFINQVGNGVSAIQFTVGFQGSNIFMVGTNGVTVTAAPSNPAAINIGSGSNNYLSFSGYGWLRNDTDIVNAMGLHNGNSAQAWRVYNTRDAATIGNPANYERGVFDWTTTANTLTIGTQTAGTGTQRTVTIGSFNAASPNNVASMRFNSNPQAFMTFGGSDYFQFQPNFMGFISTTTLMSWGSDLTLYRATAGVLGVNAALTNSPTGWLNWGGQSRVTSDVTFTSTTTLGTVTGLSVSVQAGRTYGFEAILQVTDAAAGGVQAAIAGTATATAIQYTGYTIADNAIKGKANATALGTAVGSTTTTETSGILVSIVGTITVNAAGTLLVQAAQNTSNATATTIKRGSTFTVYDIA